MDRFTDWTAFFDERIKAGSANLLHEAIRRMEQELVAHVLDIAGGDPVQASKILGMPVERIRRVVEGIDPAPTVEEPDLLGDG